MDNDRRTNRFNDSLMLHFLQFIFNFWLKGQIVLLFLCRTLVELQDRCTTSHVPMHRGNLAPCWILQCVGLRYFVCSQTSTLWAFLPRSHPRRPGPSLPTTRRGNCAFWDLCCTQTMILLQIGISSPMYVPNFTY